ncbi:PREDICTED: programmed cell death protein 2-like [Rhagoletis zephyria]|uniref:programmed cell death protein 2-like n=1 Tax=Rhagoletis zephyria TaxID=28612 RepID=UPI000811269C|nr:PREDICTED: programmed cell death protein 2-like [Rhagoletis zephyria]
MAKNKSTVYLGFEDEEVTGKHGSILNSTVNKVGGTPDWPSGEIKVPSCPLCGTARPLIVQLYAPLELSQFHRTLYVFGCLNPACSQSSKSWLCIRTQHLDTPSEAELISAVPPPLTAGGGGGKKKKNKLASNATQPQKITWCSGADDWGEAGEESIAASDNGVERMDTGADELHHQNEENGNVIGNNDNSPFCGEHLPQVDLGNSDVDEDDDDESNSMDNELVYGFGQLDMHSPQNVVEDPNANCAAGNAAAAAAMDGGAMMGFGGATATICAEIEGAETDVVLVESPLKPERDLIALLKHTATPAALGPLAKTSDVTIKPFFIAVDLEQRHKLIEFENYGGALSADHIRDLYQEYKRQDEAANSPNGLGACGGASGEGLGAAGDEKEVYEKTLPAHGDIIFHRFVSTIQQNPGQIIRYSRDTLPLLMGPLSEAIPKCANCNGETICEIQILSTLIPKLRLQQNSDPVPIEYGNVLVFTCLKCCWDTPDKMRYERVIVQAEL